MKKTRKKMPKRRMLVIAVVSVVALMVVVRYEGSSADPGGPPPKLEGHLVSLQSEFVLNLDRSHYAKVSVALLVSDEPPVSVEGAAILEQDAAVRAVITDELTGLPPEELIDRQRRHRLRTRLLAALRRGTDEHVEDVLLTDIAVQ